MAKTSQGEAVLISKLAFSLLLQTINFECRTFMKIAIFKNLACVALKSLISLFGHLVACSGRKCGNRQIDGWTDKMLAITLAACARQELMKVSTYM